MTKQDILRRFGIKDILPTLWEGVKDIPKQAQDIATMPSRILGLPHPPMESKLATEAIPTIARWATKPIISTEYQNPRLTDNIPRFFQGKPPIIDTGNQLDITPADIAVGIALGKQGIEGIQQRTAVNQGLQKTLATPVAEAEILQARRRSGLEPWPAGREPIDITPGVTPTSNQAVTRNLPIPAPVQRPSLVPAGVMGGGKTSYIPTPMEANKLKEITPSSMNIVNLNKDTVVKDLFGNVKTYKKGEDIHIYQDKNTGKALVKDGDWGLLPNKSVQQVQQSGSLLGEKPTQEVYDAVKNTVGAKLTDEGLEIDIQRFQKPEQAGEKSIRTGVFYLPELKSPYAKYYSTGKFGYGGGEKITGKTSLKTPLFIKAGTGGKGVERAYDQIEGKGSYQKMRDDVLSNAWTKEYNRKPDVNSIAKLLEKYGGNPDLASEIARVSKEGNTLPYAIQEHISAHVIRKAGYDSVVSYSKSGQQPRLAEVFDLRAINYPDVGTIHEYPEFYNNPQVKARMLGQPKGGGMTTPREGGGLPIGEIEENAQKIANKLRKYYKGQIGYSEKEIERIATEAYNEAKNELMQVGKSPTNIGEPPKIPPKPTAVAPDEPDPINNLNISGAAKEKLKEAADSIAKELGDIKGTAPLSHAEVIEAAKTADVLNRNISREATLKLEAQILKAKQHLGALAEGKGISKELIDTLKVLSTEATNAGRVLESHKIEALPEYASIKIKLIKELIRMGKDADEIIRLAEGVDFTNQKDVTKFYRQFITPKLKELISEYRYINLLSSPKTHIVNTFSNILQTLGLNPATKLFSGEMKNIPDYYAGIFDAIPEASKLALNALKGNIYIERPDLARIPSGNPLLRPFQIIPRALEASDVFFRTLVKNGEMATGKSEAEAMKKAQYFVFRQELDPTNKTKQGHLLSAIDSLTSGVYNLRRIPYAGPVVSWFIPFLQTPMNIFKQGIEYSPVGFSTIPGADNKKEQFGKAMFGSLILLGAGYLALKDRTTWAVPRGKKEKEMFYSAGMQPYSIKIGDKWVSYSRIGPLAFPIAMAAAIKYASQDSKTALTDSTLQKIGKTMGGVAGFFADQSYLQGVNDLVNFVSGDVNASAKTIANAGSQLVPLSSLLRWVNNMVDPIYRKTEKGFSLGAIGENVIKGIPGLSNRLEPYTNQWGKPSKKQLPFLNAIIPTTVSKEKPYEANRLKWLMQKNQRKELNKSGKKIKRTIIKSSGQTKQEILASYGLQ